MLLSFSVGTGAPCVAGHFPGKSIVPGAYILAQVDVALRQYYPEWTLGAFKKVKFIANLLPEQQAQIDIDDTKWPRLKINVSHQGIEVLRASAEMFQPE